MKHHLKATLSLFAVAALLLSTATGCTSPQSGTTDSKSKEPAPPPESSAASPVDTAITGTLQCILPDLPNNYQIIVDKLAGKYPDLKVNVEVTRVPDMDAKINMAHASGQGYDFIGVNNSSVQQFYAAGILEPLDGYLQKAGIRLEDNYSQALLHVGQVDKVQYAIPQSPDCRVLAYNKKLLTEGGFEVPKTQEDILAISKALTKDGVYGYARQMNSLSAVYNEGCFMLGDGAQICTEENGAITGSCNTPEMIGQVEFWKQMMPYMPADMNFSDDQVRSMFAQGKLVFYVFGPWEIGNEITESMTYDVEYGLIPTPGKVKNGSISGGFYVGIGAGSKNKEAAWAYIEESLDPEVICQLEVTLPADQRCYELPPYNEPIYQPFKEAFQSATPPYPYSVNFNKIADIFYEYFNRALIGGEDSAEMMALCDQEINKLSAE